MHVQMFAQTRSIDFVLPIFFFLRSTSGAYAQPPPFIPQAPAYAQAAPAMHYPQNQLFSVSSGPISKNV
jgi:hypothetical protein